MEKEISEVKGCTREIKIKLTNDEIKPYYQNAYEKVKSKVDLPGFRKGRVPYKVIKQRFGDEIEAEADVEAVGVFFDKIIKDEKLSVVGDISIKNVERNDENIEFTISFEVLPDIELKDYKEMKIIEPVHVVEDEEIDEKIQQILLYNSSYEDCEQITDEQFVVELKFKEVDKGTNLPIVGAKPLETRVYLADETVMPELRDKLIDLKINDTFIFNPQIDDENAPDKAFEVNITGVQKLVPPELTNEFVKEYSKDRLETVQDFKEEVGFELQNFWDEKSRELMEKQIIDQLVDNNIFPVPETPIKKYIEAMKEDIKKKYGNTKKLENISDEQFAEDLRPLAEKDIRWEMIKNKIIEKEDIKVEDYDIEPIVEAEAERLKSDKEAIKKSLLENTNFTSRILSKKAMDLIMDFAEIEEVDFEEFNKRLNEMPDSMTEDENENESRIITP